LIKRPLFRRMLAVSRNTSRVSQLIDIRVLGLRRAPRGFNRLRFVVIVSPPVVAAAASLPSRLPLSPNYVPTGVWRLLEKVSPHVRSMETADCAGIRPAGRGWNYGKRRQVPSWLCLYVFLGAGSTCSSVALVRLWTSSLLPQKNHHHGWSRFEDVAMYIHPVLSSTSSERLCRQCGGLWVHRLSPESQR
jgi:hypothetical protein